MLVAMLLKETMLSEKQVTENEYVKLSLQTVHDYYQIRLLLAVNL